MRCEAPRSLPPLARPCGLAALLSNPPRCALPPTSAPPPPASPAAQATCPTRRVTAPAAAAARSTHAACPSGCAACPAAGACSRRCLARAPTAPPPSQCAATDAWPGARPPAAASRGPVRGLLTACMHAAVPSTRRATWAPACVSNRARETVGGGRGPVRRKRRSGRGAFAGAAPSPPVSLSSGQSEPSVNQRTDSHARHRGRQVLSLTASEQHPFIRNAITVPLESSCALLRLCLRPRAKRAPLRRQRGSRCGAWRAAARRRRRCQRWRRRLERWQ